MNIQRATKASYLLMIYCYFRTGYINQILSLNVFGISWAGGGGEGKISRIPMFTEQILIELSYIPENVGDAKLNKT